MEGKIRKKGTYILSFVDVSEEASEATEAPGKKNRHHKLDSEESADAPAEKKYYTAPSQATPVPEG
jgi:hypothetical protein